MSLVNHCDRCGKQQKDTMFRRFKPDGWETVRDKELCPDCAKQLDDFLKPLAALSGYREISNG